MSCCPRPSTTAAKWYARWISCPWFEVDPEEPDNIRIADDLLIDLLFVANGHSYESLLPHVRVINVHGVPVRTLAWRGCSRPR